MQTLTTLNLDGNKCEVMEAQLLANALKSNTVILIRLSSISYIYL
jgi:hypothetical protein